MRKTVLLILALAATLQGFARSKADSLVFTPKGEWSVGAQITALSLGADDGNVMMVLRDVNNSSSLKRFSLQGTYNYCNNMAVGLRLTYMRLDEKLDGITLDLLNEGLQFSLSDIQAATSTFRVSAFNRFYYPIDKRGLFGLFCDLSLSYAYNTTQTKLLDTGTIYSNKISLGFAPGLQVFVMNNVSLGVSLGLADISYTSARSNEKGTRSAFGARGRLNLADLNFGINIHF